MESGDNRVNLKVRLSKHFDKLFGKSFGRYPERLYLELEEKVLLPLKICILTQVGYKEIGLVFDRDKGSMLRFVPRTSIDKNKVRDLYVYYWKHCGFTHSEVFDTITKLQLKVSVMTTDDEEWIVSRLPEVWEWINKK